MNFYEAICVISLKEKTTQHWFSYKGIVFS